MKQPVSPGTQTTPGAPAMLRPPALDFDRMTLTSHFMFRQKGDEFRKQFLAICSPRKVPLNRRKHFVDLRAHSFANVLAFHLPGVIVEHANEGFGGLSSQMLLLAELHELHARSSLRWLLHGVGRFDDGGGHGTEYRAESTGNL